MKKSARFAAFVFALLLLFSPFTVGADGGAAAEEYPYVTEHAVFMNGKEDGLFHPGDSLTRAEAAQIIYNLSDDCTEYCSFSDVEPDAWYAAAVGSLASRGVIVGYRDGTFRPNSPVTRAELTAVLTRVSGQSVKPKKCFRDVGASHWASAFVAAAQKNGWVNGYPDGTFRPDAPVTRAEATAIMNRVLGRSPDGLYLVFSSDLRLFPDVGTDAWYYADVTEASVPHTARFEREGASETWEDARRVGTVLRDGFHFLSGKLYLVRDGFFEINVTDGVFGDVRYSCSDAGVCFVSATFLTAADGTEHYVDPSCGTVVEREEGPVEIDGRLYCLDASSTVIRGDWRGMYFGADGAYTSGNPVIDSFVDGIIEASTNASMTPLEKFRACYEYVFYHVDYRANNDHVPIGADASEWCEKYMLRLIEQGKGNCYCYAAEMYYIARRLGFWQAKAISGAVTVTRKGEHGWLEITLDGVDTVTDPELEQARFKEPGHVFLAPYGETPWIYHRP